MNLTWIMYRHKGSQIVHRVVVSQFVRNIRSLDDCDKILAKWTCDIVESVGFYPVGDKEFDDLPDDAVFYHVP